MKTNELRIGNLFKEKFTGVTIQVMGLFKDGSIVFDHEPDAPSVKWQAEPITLTSELLNTFGFVKIEGDSGPFASLEISKDHANLALALGDMSICLYGSAIEFKIGHFAAFDTPIKYLHQLQNLYFFLTGEELTPYLPPLEL